MAARTTLSKLTNNRIRNSYKRHHRAYLTTKRTSTWFTKTMIQHLKSSTSKRKNLKNFTTTTTMMTVNLTAKTHTKITTMTNTTMKVKILCSTTIKKIEVTASKITISKIGMIREARKLVINNQNKKSAIFVITR